MSPYESYFPEEVLKYIGDVEYPASTRDLLNAARVQGPSERVEQLEILGPQQFAGPTAISAALRRPQGVGRPGCANEGVHRPG